MLVKLTDSVFQEISKEIIQPLKCINLWVIGYIANRTELIHRFGLSNKSSIDDLLLFLYQHIGVLASAKIIKGPCSWAIWENNQKHLYVITDRMGLAPIYYTEFAKAVWIGTDAETLIEQAGIHFKINPRAAVAKINNIRIPEGETIYQGVFQFAPGAIYTYSNGNSNREFYWQPTPQPILKLKDDMEYAEALRTLLVEVVDEHVPREHFSLTLSSGMDSSSIAGALRLARPNESLPCIGWVMPELDNEEEWIRATSQKLNLELTTLQVDQFWPLKPDSSYAKLPYTVYYQEAWIATYLEMKKQDKQVLITGVMGDQCFGNISSYPDLLLSLRWFDLAKQVRYELLQGFHDQPTWQTPLRMIIKPLRNYVQEILPTTKLDSPVPWLPPAQKILYDQVKYANQKPFKIGLPARVRRWWEISNPGTLQNLLPYHKLAHAFGIELRHPLWDHRILEFALQLPTNQTYRGGIQKFILRNSMRDILPDKVVTLRKKILPNNLHHRGLRERSIEQVQNLLTNMKLAEMGFVLPEELSSAYENYLTRKTGFRDIYPTLMLESQVRAWP